ncbi:MAG: hypothetical protein QXE95_04075 [Candidatus Nitrosocaldus sp.]
MIIKVDKKGRFYLPSRVRGKIKGEAYLLEMNDGTILLIPKPEDPVRELEEIGRVLPKKTLHELKRDIEEQAMRELA